MFIESDAIRQKPRTPMKNSVDIQVTIFAETQARYPHIDWRKFKILYDGWRAQGLRNKTHSAPFYTTAWRRGYLAPKDANELRKYIGLC